MSGPKGLVAGIGLGAVAVLLGVAVQLRDIGGIGALFTRRWIIIRPPQSPVRVVGGSITFRATQWNPVSGHPHKFTTPSDTSQIHLEDVAQPGQETSYTIPANARFPWRIKVLGHGPQTTDAPSTNGIEISGINGIITLAPINDGTFFKQEAIPINTANGPITGKRYRDIDCDISGDPPDKVCNHIGQIVVIVPGQTPAGGVTYVCPGGECSFGIGPLAAYNPLP